MTESTTNAPDAPAAGDDAGHADLADGRRRRGLSPNFYSYGGLALLAFAVLFSGDKWECDGDDSDPDPPPATTAPPVTTAAPVTTRPPTTTAPQNTCTGPGCTTSTPDCWLFCDDFEIENQDGSTTVYDHETGTMVTTQPDGTHTQMNVHTGQTITVDPHAGTTTTYDPQTGETTTESTVHRPASQADIEQQFVDYDGQNGRNGAEGVNALNAHIELHGLTEDGDVPRDAVNYAHCVSFGLSGCDINDPVATQRIMFEEGVSQGYTGSGDPGDFHGEEGTTNFENGIWFDRCPNSICGGGYRPPGGHSGDDGGPCSGGLTVVSTYTDPVNNDDGCRPPHCDFGRDADGWCLPPGSSDPPVVYVISPAPTVENAGSVRFAVALSHAYTQDVTVDVATSDGTATEGDDYQAVSQQITVPARNTVGYVSVPLVDDSTHETPEDFTMTLSNVSPNADLSQTPTADATINDDDPRPPVILSISGTPSVTEGGRMEFDVTPDVAPAVDATVRFRVKPEYYWGHPLYVEEGYRCGNPPTADYAEIPNDTVTFPAGAAWSQKISIETCDDIIDEQDKVITVELFDPVNAGLGTKAASGTLLDNDVPSPYPPVTNPTFFIDSPTVTEGNDLTFTITFLPIGAVWGGAVTATLSGEAVLAAAGAECSAGVDAHLDRTFTPSQDTYSRTQNLWEGGEEIYVRLLTCDDLEPESLETLTATLTTRRSGFFGRVDADVGNTGTGTIIDDDAPQVTIEGPVSAVEGSPVDFKVVLDAAHLVDVTVTVATADDTAGAHPASAMLPGLDYLPSSGRMITIPAGSTEATVSISTNPDAIDEFDETFMLRIVDAEATFPVAIGAASEAVGTITDNDAEPTITVSDATAIESNTMSFTVRLSHASEKGVTVDAATTAGTASAAAVCGAADGSEDYRSASESLSFGGLSTVAVFNVTVCDDTAVETNETFLASLSSPVNAALGVPPRGTGIIIDNDTTASCSGTCPLPVIQDPALLTNTAGGDLTLRISVDVTSAGVEPVREFAVTATGGTAVAGTHYDMAAQTLTFDATNPTHEITIPTYARYDHGTGARSFTITIQDTHPSRTHITVTATGTLNPPAIGRQ